MAGIGHRGFMGRSASAFCPYLPGLYTESEIDDLVFIDGYIPVYDAAEFDKIRTGAVEEMGGCTKWRGNYTTGGNKKYVQVMNIDFDSFGTWTDNIVLSTGFRYDGNELVISNISATDLLFSGSGADFRNMRLGACSHTSSIVGAALLYTGNNLTAYNIEAELITVFSDGFNVLDSSTGGLFGSVNGVVDVDGIYFDGSVEGARNVIGGVFGLIDATSGTVNNVSNSATTTATCAQVGTYGIIGGIAGVIRGCGITNCTNNADVSGAVRTGGCFGDANTTIDNCINNGNISAINGGCAGILGLINIGSVAITDCTNNGDIENTGGNSAGIISNPNGNISGCLNTGNITGSSFTGGICGTAGNITIATCRNDGLIDGADITGGIVGEGGNIVFCQNHGNITSASFAGGIIGRMSNNTTISTSVNYGNVSTTLTGLNANAGGVIGVAASQTINVSECANIGGNVTSAGQGVGGVCGDARMQMQDCYSLGGVITGTGRVGGLCGSCIGGSQVATWDNCYSTSIPVSAGTKGGLCGQVFSGSLTVNNSYWDTVASGIATSPRGVGKTTSELQTPVTNSGIYSSWTIPPWDFGTSSEYPKLINIP